MTRDEVIRRLDNLKSYFKMERNGDTFTFFEGRTKIWIEVEKDQIYGMAGKCYRFIITLQDIEFIAAFIGRPDYEYTGFGISMNGLGSDIAFAGLRKAEGYVSRRQEV